VGANTVKGPSPLIVSTNPAVSKAVTKVDKESSSIASSTIVFDSVRQKQGKNSVQSPTAVSSGVIQANGNSASSNPGALGKTGQQPGGRPSANTIG